MFCLKTIAILVFLLLSSPLYIGFTASKPMLSPSPHKITLLTGQFTMTSTVNLSGIAEADRSTRSAVMHLLKEQHITINSSMDKSSVNLQLKKSDSPGSNAEGYSLELQQQPGSGGQITIEAATDTGLYYGIQTLSQLLRQSALPNMRIEDFPAVARRGIVEGFYGTPWSHEDRLNQLAFYGAQKLNTYIYAPKDDPYHRQKWRDPYPEKRLRQLEELIQTAKDNKVDFVFAISPGIDIELQGAGSEADYNRLVAKLESLYQKGVRSFAVYFDDIDNKDGALQARLLNRIQQEFIRNKADANALITVPTEYFSADMLDQDNVIKPYTDAFSRELDPSIEVMYTGPGVVCPEITQTDLSRVTKLYNRKIAVWWNYPVNDYLPGKLALGPIVTLPPEYANYSAAFIMNPMEQAELSKISMQTGADFAWNPAAYDTQQAWKLAVDMQYGKLSSAMQCFAAHSSYMKNNWAEAGRLDAPELKELMENFWAKFDRKESTTTEFTALQQAFSEMEFAAQTLISHLPAEILNECNPQLQQFKRIAEADLTALRLLNAKLQNDATAHLKLANQLKKQSKDIEQSEAKISEDTGVTFIRRSLSHGQIGH